MSDVKIPLQRIEEGRVLKQLVQWFKISSRTSSLQLNALRRRSRLAATRTGLRSKDIPALIAHVRSRRAKT